MREGNNFSKNYCFFCHFWHKREPKPKEESEWN